jgi:hypothetical protein
MAEREVPDKPKLHRLSRLGVVLVGYQLSHLKYLNILVRHRRYNQQNGQNWINLLDRTTDEERTPKQILQYKANGRRNRGRFCKGVKSLIIYRSTMK